MKKIDKTHFNLNNFNIPDMVAQACNPSPWDVDVGGSEVHGHSWLHSDAKARLKYIKLCLKKMKDTLGGGGAHL